MKLHDRSSAIQLQVTACVFRSNYAFHLIAEGLTVCPFSGGFSYDLPFCRYGLWSHVPYFRNLDNVTNTVASCFSPLFHCQTHLKNAKFNLYGSEKCQLANLVAHRDRLTVTVLQSAACIFRQFYAITTVWHSTSVVGLYLRLFLLALTLPNANRFSDFFSPTDVAVNVWQSNN